MNFLKLPFKNKNIIITGASEGLGFELAKKFVENYANLIICSSNKKRIKSAFLKLIKIKKTNQNIYFCKTNLSNEKEIYKFIKFINKKFTKIDCIINNAAILGPMGNLEDVNWKKFKKTFQINFFSSALIIKLLLPKFKKQKVGKIIQLAGGGSSSPSIKRNPYAASKSAITRLVENVSEELKILKINVQINSVSPGVMKTKMFQRIIRESNKILGNKMNKELRVKNKKKTDYDKIIELIFFLSSRFSNKITGKNISADWDNWKNWSKDLKKIRNSNLYTIRRIVGSDRNFTKGDIVNRSRKKSWV